MQSDPTVNAPAGPVTATDLARMLPGGNIIAGRCFSWDHISIQRFRFDLHDLDVSGFSDHVIALQMGGPVLIDARIDGGARDRRWFEHGQMNLNPAGMRCRRLLKGRSDVMTVHLKPRLINDIFEEVYDRDPAALSLNPMLTCPDWQVNALLPMLMEEALSSPVGAGLMAGTIGRVLGLHLLRHHSSAAPLPPERRVTIPAGRMRRVIDYMHEHLDAELSLADLAKLCQLSQSHFSRAFRDATGMPAHRYLLRLRLDHAKELLERTDTPVIDIALECGFAQPSHFSTMFRTHIGVCPRAWRTSRRA